MFTLRSLTSYQLPLDIISRKPSSTQLSPFHFGPPFSYLLAKGVSLLGMEQEEECRNAFEALSRYVSEKGVLLARTRQVRAAYNIDKVKGLLIRRVRHYSC